MAVTTGFVLPPVSAAGVPLTEQALFTGPPNSRSISMCTPDLGDKTSWYQKSIKVTDEVLTDSGNGLLFNSANPDWINIDSPRLTYTHKQVPKRDGTWGRHSDWRTVIKANDVVVPPTDYSIDFPTGKVTFNTSKAGSTIKCTYFHLNGVVNPSEWIMVPPPGKKYVIEHVEMQFSSSIQTFGTIRFEIWAGGTLTTYGNGTFPDVLWEAGYGQFRADYRNINDFINAANEGKGTIPACGGLTHPVCVMPFNYVQAVQLDSAMGTLFRICILDNQPIANTEIITATFYLQIL